jgi:transposase
MPKLLRARPPLDAAEARRIRRLAGSRHAPGDWIRRARMIARSWGGLRTAAIAHEPGCHPQAVRGRLLRFNAEGLDGLGDRPGSGRGPRLTESERGVIPSLVATDPPGRLVRQPHGELEADDERGSTRWTLDAPAEAARAHGIHVERSQVRRIFLAAGARWRETRSWAVSRDPDFGPTGRRSSPSTRPPQPGRRPSAWASLARRSRAPTHRPPAGRPPAIVSRRPWTTGVDRRRPGSTAPFASETVRL